MRHTIAALLLTCVVAATAVGAENSPAERILRGLDTVPRPGVPGVLCVFGDDAEPVLTANDRAEPVIASATFGKGRAVAFAHSGFLGVKPNARDDDPHRVLLDNALHWAAGRESKLRVAIDAPSPAAAAVAAMGHEVVAADALSGKSGAHVLIWHSNAGTTPADDARVLQFVESGGGLIVAQCPWGWEQINGRRGMTLVDNLPENNVLRRMGMVFAQGTADANQGGRFAVAKSRPDDAHAGRALAAVVAGGDGASSQVHLVEKAIRSLPADDARFRPAVAKAVKRVKPKSFPRPSARLSRRNPLARLAVAYLLDQWHRAAPDDVPAAPGADEFPGAVAKGAERVQVELRLDPAVPGRVVTGLYLAPGDVLTVRRTTTTTRTTGKPMHDGWRVRVGAHSDKLWHKDVWQRWPEISRTADVEGTTRVASPFGGAVYFEGGTDIAEVRVSGAVRAPRFVLGVDDTKSWKAARDAPGPWAELEGRHMVLSVPSDVARRLDDPAPLLEWWDSVLLSHCELGRTPPPKRRERFVPDVQISAGYMHSGYPIMTQIDVVTPKGKTDLPHMVDVERLRKEGGWGFFHELGHNRQRKAWTFGGTGEVTCNLFSLYSHENVVGIPFWEHSWLGNQKKAAAKHLENGAPFDVWKRKPGIALVTYALFLKSFGWEPVQTVFAEYEAIPERDWPKTDPARIDQFVARLSRACDRDLRPYFIRWGWPLGPDVRADDSLSALAPWIGDFAEITGE